MLGVRVIGWCRGCCGVEVLAGGEGESHGHKEHRVAEKDRNHGADQDEDDDDAGDDLHGCSRATRLALDRTPFRPRDRRLALVFERTPAGAVDELAVVEDDVPIDERRFDS